LGDLESMIHVGSVSSEGGPFLLADARAEGPGAADVFAPSGTSLRLVQGLYFDGDWNVAIRTAAAAPIGETNGIGHVDLPSGVLAVLWSPENGASVSDDDLLRGNGRPGGFAIDGSSLLTKLPPGRYSCFADMVRVTQGSALRCSVVPYGTQP
jgi:hypothetical protein